MQLLEVYKMSNVNGIRTNAKPEIQALLTQHRVDITAVNETKLHSLKPY